MEELSALLEKHNVLLHAPAGAGKTFLLAELIRSGRHRGIYCTAMTGAAAAAIAHFGVCAYTLHAWAGIRLGRGTAEELAHMAANNNRAKKRWMRAQYLIIDEVSMLGGDLFDKLDYVGRAVRGIDAPFGGVRLLLSGDFLQLQPVKDTWAFKSVAWKAADIRPFPLHGRRRFTDQRFANLLNRARRGFLNEEDISLLRSRILPVDESALVKPTMLFSHRGDMNAINARELEKLPGPERVYEAVDSFWINEKGKRRKKAPPNKERYYQVMDPYLPRQLRLRVGAQVMLRVNKDIDAGLVNGSRGVVTAMDSNTVTVFFANGATMAFGPEPREAEDDLGGMERRQFPFVLAWALTIHCSQGSTLDCVRLSIDKKVFAAGQAYVALSRVRSLDSLYLDSLEPARVRADPEALAFVSSLRA